MEKIKNISEFVTLLHVKLKKIKLESSLNNMWYRGEQNVNYPYPLTPKALRFEDGPNRIAHMERSMVAEFSREAEMYFSNKSINNNSWNKYILMQHYGMKTRLLDWSMSPLIALFFAVYDLNSGEDAVVWLLNPHELNLNSFNQMTLGKQKNRSIYFPQLSNKYPLFDQNNEMNLDELFRIYLQYDFGKEHKNFSESFLPLSMYPYLLDDRMRNQQSCFTIFGNLINGLRETPNFDDFMQSIIIDKNFKNEIRNELNILGISEKLVFPDLGGIGKDIEYKFRD